MNIVRMSSLALLPMAASLALLACNREATTIHPEKSPEEIDGAVQNGEGGEIVPIRANGSDAASEITDAREFYEKVILPHNAARPSAKTTSAGIYQYWWRFRTGDNHAAGTNARVWGQMLGSAGTSVEQRLDHGDYNDFEPNQTDTWVFDNLPDYGDLTQFRIRHDNSGSGPGWQISWIHIYKCDVNNNCVCNVFDLGNNWLATNLYFHTTNKTVQRTNVFNQTP